MNDQVNLHVSNVQINESQVKRVSYITSEMSKMTKNVISGVYQLVYFYSRVAHCKTKMV